MVKSLGTQVAINQSINQSISKLFLVIIFVASFSIFTTSCSNFVWNKNAHTRIGSVLTIVDVEFPNVNALMPKDFERYGYGLVSNTSAGKIILKFSESVVEKDFEKDEKFKSISQFFRYDPFFVSKKNNNVEFFSIKILIPELNKYNKDDGKTVRSIYETYTEQMRIKIIDYYNSGYGDFTGS